MGGGGVWYDRDVTSTRRRSPSGYSDVAEEALSRSKLDSAVLPKERRVATEAKDPLVYAFDVTGSMGKLPKIIYDKMPMMAGQIAMNGYLKDVAVSLAAIGDVACDRAPLQVCDFAQMRNLDEWLTRLYLEGGGGGQCRESYEFIAYYYANCCDVPDAETPLFLFTGDEGFREALPAAELAEHFGGKHQSVDAYTVFKKLRAKFKGNVFLLHRQYESARYLSDKEIVAMWQKALGRERVVILPEDLAIADVTLGIIALASGARTLEAYLEDMRNRPLDIGGETFEAQSSERIAQVREALSEFATLFPEKKKSPRKASSKKRGDAPETSSEAQGEDWRL